ncbi:hypothetical protein NHF40_12735 [Maricaulaceae bacterium EIL42A08]|nr:hypothetical protein [Maricaulaceae bacterium EIL42A08]
MKSALPVLVIVRHSMAREASVRGDITPHGRSGKPYKGKQRLESGLRSGKHLV